MLYRLSDVELAFSGRQVIRGLSFQHNPGEKVILVGRNGSGKTTLLRLISGELEPDRGSVERASGLTMERLEQIITADPCTAVVDYCLDAFPQQRSIEAELAALEPRLAWGDEAVVERFHHLHEEFERLDGFRVRPRVEAALLGTGIPSVMHGRPIGSLSGGERTRVALARALVSPADLLLLDEPSNHLDLLGATFLADAIATRSGALMLVTHDRELIDRAGGDILEIHAGRLERYGAGYSRYRRERDMRRAHQRRSFELQQAEVARQQEFIRRNIAGQNTRQAQARQKLLDRLERLEPPERDLPAARLKWPQSVRSGERVLESNGLVVGWREPLLRGVTFQVRRGERVAVVGRNGVGKSTLLRTLAGIMPALGGAVRFGSGVIPGLYDQEHADLPVENTVLLALLDARPDWAPADARTWAARFGFSGEAADRSCAALSGGERSRLALARLLGQGPNLMLLDEPTNHLDLPTCEALEEALSDFPGAVLLVSHDRRLVERVATAALLLEDGRASFLDRVDTALERVGLQPARRPARDPHASSARRSAVEEERRRLRRDAARARALADSFLAEVGTVERRLGEIDELLCTREVFADHNRARELSDEAVGLRERLDGIVADWQQAEEDASALEIRLAELDNAAGESK